jgi:phosphatidylglycerophosphatase C
MVERTSIALRSASARELTRQLEALREPGKPAALAFDGDGTLWSGDVSEDVFAKAVRAGLLREDARAALADVANRHGVSEDGTASEIAARLFVAYREQRFPEREVCEVMTWCYAGFSIEELQDYARHVLQALDIGARLNRQLEPILDWARSEGLRTIVVSASPRAIVEVAASLWQFAPADIAASDAALAGSRILPSMHGEVPYAAAKCLAGQRLLGDADWLASFGDNLYDIDMLRAARLGVAVTPKPALRKLLPELPFVVLLT